MSWIAFYVVLTLGCWLPIWPMLRAPRVRLLWEDPEPFMDVPIVTFDSRGMV